MKTPVEQLATALKTASSEASLRIALHEACEQLEGWVAWKCPRKYKPEHMAHIARLRAAATGEAPTPASLPKVVGIEVLIWHAPEDPRRPDAETEVLVHSRDRGILTAVWDEDARLWLGDSPDVLLTDVIGWAEPRGVE